MRIQKVINNNFAVVVDSNGSESIARGNGICFGKKAGDHVEKPIDKTYILRDYESKERFHNVAAEVLPECLYISTKIIDLANEKIGKKLNDNIYGSLTDHIQFTINRYEQGLQLKNDMLWHIKRMYPLEFEIGQYAVQMIYNQFDILLHEDECSFIAMHLVSAQSNESLDQTIEMTKITKSILNIVESHFNSKLNEESDHFFRFLTHLQFFAKRLLDKKTYKSHGGIEDPLFSSLKASYPEAFDCARKIGVYLKNKHDYRISNDEVLYFSIHIQRVFTVDESV